MSILARFLFFLSVISFCIPAGCFAAEDDSDENGPPLTAYTPLLYGSPTAPRGLNLRANTKFSQVAPGQYSMEQGCALIQAEQTMLLNSSRGQVVAKPGACIILSVHSKMMRVIDLADRKHDTVRVVFGKNHISLNPGEGLVVIDSSTPNAAKIVSENAMYGYRNPQLIKVSPEYVALHYEISLVDVLKHCRVFEQLDHSSKPEDKALLADIIKTAAAVNTMYIKSRDKYKHGADEDQTKIASKKRRANAQSLQ